MYYIFDKDRSGELERIEFEDMLSSGEFIAGGFKHVRFIYDF